MKTKTSKDILLELDLIEPNLRTIWVNYLNALQMQEGLRAVAVAQISNWMAGSCPHDGNKQVLSLVDYYQSDHSRQLASIGSIIAAMKASPELVEAEAVVKPLLANLAAAEEAQKETARIEQAAKVKLDTEKRNAIAKAIAEVEKKFSPTLKQ